MLAVEGALPALELVEFRWDGNPTGGDNIIADGVAGNAIVLGQPLTPVVGLDLALEGVVYEMSGRIMATNAAAEVLGNPLNSLAWLANHLGDRGLGLRAGDLVMSGSISALLRPKAGDVVTARFHAACGCRQRPVRAIPRPTAGGARRAGRPSGPRRPTRREIALPSPRGTGSEWSGKAGTGRGRSVHRAVASVRSGDARMSPHDSARPTQARRRRRAAVATDGNARARRGAGCAPVRTRAVEAIELSVEGPIVEDAEGPLAAGRHAQGGRGALHPVPAGRPGTSTLPARCASCSASTAP